MGSVVTPPPLSASKPDVSIESIALDPPTPLAKASGRRRAVLRGAGVESAAEDLALVRRLLGGDEPAYTLVRAQVERAFAQVWGRLTRRHGDLSAHRADLLQSLELFLVKDEYRVLATYRGDARLSTWLHAVAMRYLGREVTRLRTRQARERPEVRFDVPNAGTDPEGKVVRASERARVRRVVEGLPQEDRLLVALLFEQGLDATQASRVLGIRPAGVRMRKKRLLSKLEAQLGGES